MISIDEPCNSSLLLQGSPKSNEIMNPPLPADFEPNSYSIICGRGSSCYNSVGNRRFRVIVNMFLEQYSRANTKLAKSNIVSQVMDTIHSAGGTFVKQQQQKDGGQWYQVSTTDARKKVGAQFRDCLHEQYRSAAKSKLARRKKVVQRNNNCFNGNGNDSFSSFDSTPSYSEFGDNKDNDCDDEPVVLGADETNDWQDDDDDETFTVSPDIFEA